MDRIDRIRKTKNKRFEISNLRFSACLHPVHPVHPVCISLTSHATSVLLAILKFILCASAPLWLIFLTCALTTQRASAHTFHTSLMNMEYNHQEQSLEITLQVFSHDLETILSKRNGKDIRLGKTPDAEALTFAYLTDTINLKNGAGETKTLNWVGMEQKADTAWLYFETKMPEGLNGAQLRNRLFFDFLEDQVNLVHLKDQDKKTDLVFKPGDGFKPLFEAAKE
jgi:hypothetical protein